MNVSFKPVAGGQYEYWQAADKGMFKKIDRLIEKCLRDPFGGAGKPEPLTGDLSGFWSRRIDREQRLVYRATATSLEILQCRYHY